MKRFREFEVLVDLAMALQGRYGSPHILRRTQVEQFKDRYVWRADHILEALGAARREQGIIAQEMAALSPSDRKNAHAAAFTQEVSATLALEGEDSARQPGEVLDWRSMGVFEMLLDATKRTRDPLDEERIRYWNRFLGPEVPVEGTAISAWVEAVRPHDGLVRSAIAYITFPAGGLVQRAAATMMLAIDHPQSQRYLSVTRQFTGDELASYKARCNRGDVTEWIVTFLASYVKAIGDARAENAQSSRVARFWTIHREACLSNRQRAVVQHFLESPGERVTARTWAAIAATSIDTAERDLRDLVAQGVVRRGTQGGKSTRYGLVRQAKCRHSDAGGLALGLENR